MYVQMNEKDRDDMQILMFLLDIVSKVYFDVIVQEMVFDFRIVIVIYGVVWFDKLQKKVKNKLFQFE